MKLEQKYKICLIFFTFVCCHAVSNNQTAFVGYKDKFNKRYGDYSEEKNRFQAYQANQKLQLLLNKAQPVKTAHYGDTKFSDLSPKEFKEQYLSDLLAKQRKQYVNSTTPLHRLRQLAIPAKLDWRTYLNYSIVTGVKNQKKCGACWAFSTVETVESMYAKETGGSLLELSVQEVIDCSRYNGCGGGDTCAALEWMVSSKAPLVTERVYPLTDMSNECKMLYNQTKGNKVYVEKYTCLNLINYEDKMLQLLQQGPLSAAVDATTWNNYQGGVIQYHCGAVNNHAVQIVGYDLTGDVPYYIVRNSWGTDYGHDGYLYIGIGNNVCGIAETVSSATVFL